MGREDILTGMSSLLRTKALRCKSQGEDLSIEGECNVYNEEEYLLPISRVRRHVMLPIQLHEIPQSIIDEVGTVFKLDFPRQGHTSDVGILDNEQGRFILK